MFDELKAYERFAECLNFTRAAEHLLISQPALHVKIRKLAEHYGAPLYLKDGRNILLTEAGERLLVFARDALAAERRIREELSGDAGLSQVTLVAGAGSYLYLLGPPIQRFSLRFGGKLQLLTANREDSLRALRSGKADLGVTVLLDTPPDLQGRLLKEVEALVVIPRQHSLAGRKSVTIEDLADVPLIVPAAGKPFRKSLERCFEERGESMPLALEADGWELMLHFAQLGLGAAVVNGCCRIPSECVGVPFVDLPPSRYYLLRRRGQARASEWTQRLYEELTSL